MIASFLVKSNRFNALIDTGSQLSIIQKSIIEKIFKPSYIKKNRIEYEGSINSFTNHNISILYEIKIQAQASIYSNSFTLHFHVIPDLPDSIPKIILGSNMIRLFKGEIKYSAKPSLFFNIPANTQITTYFITEEEIRSARARTTIGPKELKSVKLILHTASPILVNDKILIEGMVFKKFKIIPSTSQVFKDELTKDLCAYTPIRNFLKTEISIDLNIQISLVDKDIICLNKNNINLLANKYPTMMTPAYIYPESIITDKILCLNEIPDSKNLELVQNAYIFNLRSERINNDDMINRNDTSPDDPTFDPDFQLPKGYELSRNFTPEEIVDIEQFENIKRPFIRKIFIDRYPGTLSQNSLDRGDISRTLGHYHIKLREGMILPSNRRVFSLEPTMEKHLRDILDFMTQNDIIERVPISSNNDKNFLGAPAFLVPRQKADSSCRLVIDYSLTNNYIEKEISIIPNINQTIHSLRDFFMFSCIDISNAYSSFSIDEESKEITRFNTPIGQFHFKSLPTGLSISSGVWARVIQKMLHEELVLDKNNDIILLDDGTAKMKPSFLPNCHHFFDDILISTKLGKSYKETLECHFEHVDIVMKRLSQHRVKINFSKAILAKTTIKFLGWKISNNFIAPDEKRVNKLLEAKMPETKKGIRSFLGMLQSFRACLDQETIENMYILSPLTSSTKPFKIEQEHITAFNNLKIQLTKKPLFSNIISPNAEKLLFSDSGAGKTGAYSAILAQLAEPNTSPPIPDSLVLDSRFDRYIYDNKLNFTPLPKLSDLHNKTQCQKEIKRLQPPQSSYLDSKNLGYSDDEIVNTLFISCQKLMAAYSCKILSIQEMRIGTINLIKKTEISLNYKSFVFKNISEYHEFLKNFEKGEVNIDSHLYAVDALARFLSRHFIILNGVDVNTIQKYEFNTNYHHKPKFIFSLEKIGENLIFRPYLENKTVNFNLANDSRRFEIISFHSRNLPKSKKAEHIQSLELYAILSSLHHLKGLIGNSPLTLITDNKVLYYLFSKVVQASSVKLTRWSLKLLDYPNLKVCFTPSESNPADFLSKTFLVKTPDLDRVNLRNFKITNLDEITPTNPVSIEVFKDIVEKNPQFIREEEGENIISFENKVPTMEETREEGHLCALTSIEESTERQVSPIVILESKVSREEIIKAQKIQYNEYINKLITSKKNEIVTDSKLKLFLKFGLLYVNNKTGPKILIPDTIIPSLLALFHLVTAHGGIERMQLMLSNYFFPAKHRLIREIVRRCVPCQLQNLPTKKIIVGAYPHPRYAWHTVHVDIAENLGKNRGFEHILVAVDSFSDGVLLFPLKKKNAENVFHAILYGIIQAFPVTTLLTDNAPSFLFKSHLKILATLGINKLATSALSPASKGLVESKVKKVKTILKKQLVLQDDYSWIALPIIVSKLLNSSISPKTSYSPYETTFGHSPPPFGTNFSIHPIIENEFFDIKQKNMKLKDIGENVRKKTIEKQTERNIKLNRSRLKPKLALGDICIVKDRKIMIGNPRPLKTTFSEAPYEVTKILKTTAQVKRISDGFCQIYHMNDIKRYLDQLSIFKDLPESVRNILEIKKSKEELSKNDIKEIQRSTPIHFPGGIPIDSNNLDDLDQDSDLSSDEEELPTLGTPLFTKKLEGENEDKSKVNNKNIETAGKEVVVEQPRYNLRSNIKKIRNKINKKVRFD